MTGPVAAPRVVLDASAAVALLADAGPVGEWVESSVAGAKLYAPDLMPYETANVLRRQAASGALDTTAASLAHADLVDLALELYPYVALAERVWQLRAGMTVYDASYVALAELVSAPVVTLDARLSRAPGARCRFLTYPGL